VLARQLAKELTQKKMTEIEMATRMQTNRTHLTLFELKIVELPGI
jgi:hypothetical protein